MYMNNIQKLYDVMYNKNGKNGYGWAVLSFFLYYKNLKCAVICERSKKLNKLTKYTKYWMLMKFFDCTNSNHTMSLYVIPTMIKVTPKDLEHNPIFEVMDFFGIKSNSNSLHRYHINEFCSQLNKDSINAIRNIIPTNSYLKNLSYNYIDRNDPRDRGKRYCYEIMKNNGQRSIFNDNKTQYLRNSLYHKLMDDSFNNIPGISFSYSIHEKDDNSDSDIINTATGDGTLDIKYKKGHKVYYVPRNRNYRS